MTAEVIDIASRRLPIVAHEFDCIGCDYRVYSAVHFGHANMCFECQTYGPELNPAFRKDGGSTP